MFPYWNVFPQQGTRSLHGTPRNLLPVLEFTSHVSLTFVQLQCITTRRELHDSEVRS